MIGHKHQDRAGGGSQNTVGIDPRNGRVTEGVEYPSPHDGTNDAKEQVAQDPLTPLVDQHAADESANGADDDPSEDAHARFFRSWPFSALLFFDTSARCARS